MPAIRNADATCGWPARILHWAMAGLLLFLVGLGYYTAEMVTDAYAQLEWVQIHKSWGFIAFALAALRLVWRLVNPAPALPEGMSGPERFLAHAGHLALYALMFALPVTGWLMSSASPLQELYGIENWVFDWFQLPDPFVPGDEALEGLLRAVHFWAAMGLLALVAGHAAAGLKHHFVGGDSVLRRMTFGR